MAARKGQLTETKLDEMRRRIKTTLLLKRVEEHALGSREMSSTQIRAAEMLLRKAMPDLSSVTLAGDQTVTLAGDQTAPVRLLFGWMSGA